MELNHQMQHELRRLSELSAQLKGVETLWAESYMNRQKAEERGEGMHIVCGYSVMIMNSADKIAEIKNKIVEHVHLLAAHMDAQGED